MLYTPVARRLREYREAAAKNAEIHTRPHLAGGANLESTWPTTALGVARQARRFNPQFPGGAGRWSDDRKAYYCDAWPDGWRVTGRADEVSKAEGSRRVDVTGWYTDGFQGETLSGYVLQIPARGRVPQYIPATAHSDWAGVTLYPSDICESPLDAAARADRIAELEAEKEREYQTASEAGRRWADAGKEIKEARRAALLILAERRQVGAIEAPALCDAIRQHVARLLDSIAEFRAKRDALANGDAPGLVFWTGDKRLAEAFNESAGAAVL